RGDLADDVLDGASATEGADLNYRDCAGLAQRLLDDMQIRKHRLIVDRSRCPDDTCHTQRSVADGKDVARPLTQQSSRLGADHGLFVALCHAAVDVPPALDPALLTEIHADEQDGVPFD